MNVEKRSRPLVLLLIDDMQVGGAQKVVITTCRVLMSGGYDVVVCAADGALGERIPTGCRWVKMPSPSRTIQYSTALARVIRELNPVVVHSHQRKVATIAWMLTRLRPSTLLIEHVHTQLPTIDKIWSSYRSGRLIAVGSSVVEMLMTGYSKPSNRISLLQNCVEDRFETQPDLNLQEPGVRLLAIGRMVEQKSPDRLARLVQELGKNGVTCEGIWVGDGPLRASVEDLTKQLNVTDRMSYVGECSDIDDFLRWATVVVVLSSWEGLPLVILEAFSAGRPVVAYDVGSVRDAVDSKTGWLIEEGTPLRDLARQIAPDLVNYETMMSRSENARSRYLRNFSERAYKERLLKIYETTERSDG